MHSTHHSTVYSTDSTEKKNIHFSTNGTSVNRFQFEYLQDTASMEFLICVCVMLNYRCSSYGSHLETVRLLIFIHNQIEMNECNLHYSFSNSFLHLTWFYKLNCIESTQYKGKKMKHNSLYINWMEIKCTLGECRWIWKIDFLLVCQCLVSILSVLTFTFGKNRIWATSFFVYVFVCACVHFSLLIDFTKVYHSPFRVNFLTFFVTSSSFSKLSTEFRNVILW